MSIAEAPVEVSGPTHLDLPETDGKPAENTYQPFQSALLTGVLIPVLERLHPDGNFLAGSDTGIYWKQTKDPLQGCRAPDWYYVANVPRLLDGEFRRSYVLWQEVVSPLLVVGFVSGNGSEERDTTPHSGKFWVYEQAIKATYYAIWDPFRSELEVYERLRNQYHPLTPDTNGRIRILEMGIDLGVWTGTYQGLTADWLRAWENGRLLPTPEELADIQTQRAETEKQRADAAQRQAAAEKERAEKLAARLRELGIDPDTV
ncbi:MAG TPA: Uma2 family endonuclease [Gemmata sp.]